MIAFIQNADSKGSAELGLSGNFGLSKTGGLSGGWALGGRKFVPTGTIRHSVLSRQSTHVDPFLVFSGDVSFMLEVHGLSDSLWMTSVGI